MAEIAAHTRPASVVAAEVADVPTSPRLEIVATDFAGRCGEKRRSDAVKHALDRIVALLGLIVLLPALAVVAASVRLTSAGPALYSQQRVGRDGQLFRIWKFRTMVVNADAELQNLLAQHGRDGAPLFKVPQDPRVTRIGRVLRKYSIDEFPQLINVLLGHMSIVGPRPQRPAEVALYTEYEQGRLAVKPGLTGLWQVNGRSDLDWPEAVKLDLVYVRDRSLRMDARILASTVNVVLRARGAE